MPRKSWLRRQKTELTMDEIINRFDTNLQRNWFTERIEDIAKLLNPAGRDVLAEKLNAYTDAGLTHASTVDRIRGELLAEGYLTRPGYDTISITPPARKGELLAARKTAALKSARQAIWDLLSKEDDFDARAIYNAESTYFFLSGPKLAEFVDNLRREELLTAGGHQTATRILDNLNKELLQLDKEVEKMRKAVEHD